MKRLQLAVEILFYALVLALFVSRAVSANFSHDENQFVAAGQLLAYKAMLPYVNYPYTHMPYGIAFYALTAALFSQDFLAARLLNALAWFLCALLIVRSFRASPQPAHAPVIVLWEFAVVYLFLNNSILGHVIGNALNHSLATLFGLLGLALFVRASRAPAAPAWLPAASGASLCIAALIRFNYASLIVVLVSFILMQTFLTKAVGSARMLVPYLLGTLVAALPAAILFSIAPGGFVYGNFVYIKLNTIYYQELLYRANMQLADKLLDFWGYLLATPTDLAMYVLTFFVLARGLRDYFRMRSPAALGQLAAAGFAIVLLPTAFAPTPTQPQYFLAPIPFLCVVLSSFGVDIYQKSRVAVAGLAVALLLALHLTLIIQNPLAELSRLVEPSEWIPVQAHALAESLHQYLRTGRILTLLPMIPLEAGYDVFPFTAAGPFPWRTSLLLTPERRAQYGVTSPQELPAVLERSPLDAVLTGIESTNAGFGRNDLGGLESPFVTYARQRDFRPIQLNSPFLEQTLTLWLPPP